jgi:hypothetical protein
VRPGAQQRYGDRQGEQREPEEGHEVDLAHQNG